MDFYSNCNVLFKFDYEKVLKKEGFFYIEFWKQFNLFTHLKRLNFWKNCRKSMQPKICCHRISFLQKKKTNVGFTKYVFLWWSRHEMLVVHFSVELNYIKRIAQQNLYSPNVEEALEKRNSAYLDNITSERKGWKYKIKLVDSKRENFTQDVLKSKKKNQVSTKLNVKEVMLTNMRPSWTLKLH
jgi:hypothetical protein